MMHKALGRVCLLTAVIFASSGCSWVSSYFRGTDNTTPPADLVAIEQAISIQKLWSIKASSGAGDTFVKLRPAIAAERIFSAGHKGDVHAFDAASGQQLWQIDSELPISAGVGLSDDLVLVGSIDGAVLALRQADGSQAWRVQVSSEVLAAPIGAEGVVVIRTVDGTFIGLSAEDGSPLWSYSSPVPPLSLRGVSTPILAEDLVIAGLDNGKVVLLALADGAVVGERRIAPPQGRSEIDRLVDIDADPKLVGNELYIAAYQGNITALDLAAGKTLWRKDFSTYAGLDVDASQVYVSADDDSVWALDRSGGGSLWEQTELSGRKLSAPAALGDYVVVADLEGYLHWLDKASGRIVGRVKVGGERIDAAPSVHNDSLFVLDRDGTLSVFTPNNAIADISASDG